MSNPHSGTSVTYHARAQNGIRALNDARLSSLARGAWAGLCGISDVIRRMTIHIGRLRLRAGYGRLN